jgi:hypothetical protein
VRRLHDCRIILRRRICAGGHVPARSRLRHPIHDCAVLVRQCVPGRRHHAGDLPGWPRLRYSGHADRLFGGYLLSRGLDRGDARRGRLLCVVDGGRERADAVHTGVRFARSSIIHLSTRLSPHSLLFISSRTATIAQPRACRRCPPRCNVNRAIIARPARRRPRCARPALRARPRACGWALARRVPPVSTVRSVRRRRRPMRVRREAFARRAQRRRLHAPAACFAAAAP